MSIRLRRLARPVMGVNESHRPRPGHPLLSEWVLSPHHPDVLRTFRRRSPADSAVGSSAPPGSHAAPPTLTSTARNLGRSPYDSGVPRSAPAPPRSHPLAFGDIGVTCNENTSGIPAKSRSNESSPPVRGKTESWVFASGSKSLYVKDATTLAR